MGDRERPGPLVEVEWIDSATKHGWVDKDQLPTEAEMPCLSAGYLVDDSEGHIVLAFGAGENEYLCSQMIPRVAIQSITRMRR